MFEIVLIRRPEEWSEERLDGASLSVPVLAFLITMKLSARRQMYGNPTILQPRRLDCVVRRGSTSRIVCRVVGEHGTTESRTIEVRTLQVSLRKAGLTQIGPPQVCPLEVRVRQIRPP